MNDFTKEELEEIQGALIMTKMLEQNHDFTLTDKIQSMIDNYTKPEEPISHKYIFKAEDVSWLIKKVKDE